MTSIAAAAPETIERVIQADTSPGRALGAIEILGLAAAEPIWREIERDGHFAPYGRFDWVQAFASATPEADIRVALLRDVSGQAELVLPFAITRRFGLRLGETVGGKHTNYTVPLLRLSGAAATNPKGLRTRLAEAGRAVGIDAFAFTSVPVAWADRPNPLAEGGRASPNQAYSLVLEPTGEATIQRSMSNEARKKLRNKARGLAKSGLVQVVEARDPAMVDRILDAYFRQKSERFRELGLRDVFADPATRAFIRHASLGAEPAIELYALYVDEAILATFGGAASRDRISGMFLSFEHGKSDRFSPGDLLVHRVIELQCERGRRVFDLGVGDARYKRAVCDGIDELVDVVIPVSGLGSAYAATLAVAGDLKRRLKADPRAMAALSTIRRRLGQTKH